MTTSKTYVLDTTVLIEDPDVMYKLGNSLIVIPMAVIKELDGLKRSDVGSVAQAARAVARTLDRLGSYGDLREGVKLSSGGVLKVYNGSETVDGLASEADNRIVGAAVRLQREVSNVTLLTADGNMRTVARVNGVKAEIMGVSYERTVKKEIEMDKYRMEVERLKERDRGYREDVRYIEVTEDSNIETRSKNKLIPTHLKIALFIAGLFIVGLIFKDLYATVGAIAIAAAIYLYINIYYWINDGGSTVEGHGNILQNPHYSSLPGNIYNDDDDE